MKTYLVGGAVRDQLLALPVKERDYLVVGATPEQMLEQGFRLVGKDFPVFLHPSTHEEYALARTERKVRPGYQGFSCYAAPDVSLEADLQRRDLTINAMAQSSNGEIIDPYHGQADITHRYLRHVSPAFVEDPVRILRVARFMARLSPLGFRVAPETMQLMQTMVQNKEINALVAERVWREFSLALTEPAPQMFIRTLSACGALAVLFPVLEEYLNEFQDNTCTKKFASDGLAALKHAVVLSDDPKVRFAALLCFLGDNPDLDDADQQIGILRIEQLGQQYHIPDAYIQLAIITARYHLACHRALESDGNALLELLEKTDAFRRAHRFKQFLLACEADFRARSHIPMHPRVIPYLQKDRLLSALSACKTISARSLSEKGFHGSRLGQKLRDERRKQIDRRLLRTN